MSQEMRDLKSYQRSSLKGSVTRTISWEKEIAVEGTHPMIHTDGVRSKIPPASGLLEAEQAVAAAVARIVGLKDVGKAELSKVSWNGETKEGDDKIAVTILLNPSKASAPVAIPVNLVGQLADELLELEVRAFGYADLKEIGLGDMSYGDASAGGETVEAEEAEEAEPLEEGEDSEPLFDQPAALAGSGSVN